MVVLGQRCGSGGGDRPRFDLRGRGESGGTRYTLGIEEPRDILAAIDLAATKGGIDRSRVEHVEAFATHPTVWARHVLDFLGRELGTEKPAAGPAGILATPRRGG